MNLGAKLNLEDTTIIGASIMNYLSMNKDFEVQFREKFPRARDPLLIINPSTYLNMYLYEFPTLKEVTKYMRTPQLV